MVYEPKFLRLWVVDILLLLHADWTKSPRRQGSGLKSTLLWCESSNGQILDEIPCRVYNLYLRPSCPTGHFQTCLFLHSESAQMPVEGPGRELIYAKNNHPNAKVESEAAWWGRINLGTKTLDKIRMFAQFFNGLWPFFIQHIRFWISEHFYIYVRAVSTLQKIWWHVWVSHSHFKNWLDFI